MDLLIQTIKNYIPLTPADDAIVQRLFAEASLHCQYPGAGRLHSMDDQL